LHSTLTFDVPALRKALHTEPAQSWLGTPFDMPDELELHLPASGPKLPMPHAARAGRPEAGYSP
jgi:protein-L-isoaspartate(D-aspartate) O-methyltransferase